MIESQIAQRTIRRLEFRWLRSQFAYQRNENSPDLPVLQDGTGGGCYPAVVSGMSCKKRHRRLARTRPRQCCPFTAASRRPEESLPAVGDSRVAAPRRHGHSLQSAAARSGPPRCAKDTPAAGCHGQIRCVHPVELPLDSLAYSWLLAVLLSPPKPRFPVTWPCAFLRKNCEGHD